MPAFPNLGPGWSDGFHVFISHPTPSSLDSADTTLALYYYILALLSAVVGHFPSKNHTPLGSAGLEAGPASKKNLSYER